MGDSRIKDVSSLLSSFFDEDKLHRGERYSDFFSSWSSIVGPRLAAHSRVADVDKGLLIVEAEHPGWIQLLQLRQSGIVEEAARRYPELGLKGIAFRLSGQGGASRLGIRPETDSAPRRAAPPETAESIETEKQIKEQAETSSRIAIAAISDPEFKKLISGLKDTILGKD
jgi:hypothetical protein